MDTHNLTPSPQHIDREAIEARQRKALADMERDKIKTIYERRPPHRLKTEEDGAPGEPYDRTYSAAAYNWQDYHEAWQQYYQQYYQRYYTQNMPSRAQILSNKASSAAALPNMEQLAHTHQQLQELIVGSDVPTVVPSGPAELKATLLRKVGERAKAVRKSHHFVPIIAALCVGLIFTFLQYNRVVLADVKAYISPGSGVSESDTVLVDPTTNLNVGPDPKLIIPKINVNIKVVYDVTSLDDAPIQEGLRHGVVHYNLPGANSFPGQVGNMVILGHSSNDIFAPGDYKFAFVLLDRLEAGDIFYVHYQGTRYIYRVTDKKVIKPTEINVLQTPTNKPLATLITCTPLGTAQKRLLVTGEQISPDPAAAKAPSAGNPSSTGPAVLPGNEPTILERIRDFFF
jgi:sortase A